MGNDNEPSSPTVTNDTYLYIRPIMRMCHLRCQKIGDGASWKILLFLVEVKPRQWIIRSIGIMESICGLLLKI